MLILEPNKPYKFLYNEYNETNNIIEKIITLIFTEENLIYPNEVYTNFDSYECYDNNSRFVCYIDSIHRKYCCIKTDEDPNDGKEYWFNNIIKIYLDDNIIFTNSNHINMYKI